MVDSIREQSQGQKYIYTNHPILAVYAEQLIPPEVAVLGKQINQVEYAEDYNNRLIDALKNYNVEQIILVDIPPQLISNALQEHIDKHYKLIDQKNEILHYVWQ